jgi:hypothetical protein
MLMQMWASGKASFPASSTGKYKSAQQTWVQEQNQIRYSWKREKCVKSSVRENVLAFGAHVAEEEW